MYLVRFRYQEAFITTYRTFISPLDVLSKLVYRYERFSFSDDPTKKKAAKNCFSLLVRILDDLSSIEFSSEILLLLRDFVYRIITSGELNLGRLLHQRFVEKLHEKINGSYASSRQPAFVQLYTPERIKSISILDFKSSALAEQITYLDWFYFQRIELSEMLLWAQHQSEEHCPNLTAFTEHFNKMSYWVRTKILQQSEQKEREKYFAKFTKIMRCLRRCGNFNSCLAMLSALDSGPVRRLNWPKSLLEPLAEHGALVDSSQSFKAYRTALSEAKPPCLPYIGLILQDLTFVHVGNPDYVYDSHWPSQNDIVNFSKRWQQYTILDN
ncbi:unnamed protein product, partial [Soboliphyme baturini]|uniref:Ras-GEF domain-containing protein n=1 Tax=Soboliphyme baturini TaxID=241478 RepID=A0A183I9L6_9BILA